MKNLLKKTKKGFTIVELVIVIGVIAILSAILIPTFVNLTQKAEDARLQSNLANAYTEYYAAALDDEDIVDKARTLVYLSEESTADAAEAKYYDCNADGEWAKEAKSTTTIEFVSVYTGSEATPSYLGYYVYYAA